MSNESRQDNKRQNKILYISIIISAIIVIAMVYNVYSTYSETSKLEDEHQALIDEYAEIEKEFDDLYNDIDNQKRETMESSFGVKSQLIDADSDYVEDFFRPAFTWSDGDEYDDTRSNYIDELGEGNSFTKYYLPENKKIDTYEEDAEKEENKEGTTSFIDENSLKSEFDSIIVLPLEADDNRVKYTAVVIYHMYKDTLDNVDKSKLDESVAIMDFVVSGDPNNQERRISEVNAWSGFSSGLD